jgi:hypothetical protein
MAGRTQRCPTARIYDEPNAILVGPAKPHPASRYREPSIALRSQPTPAGDRPSHDPRLRPTGIRQGPTEGHSLSSQRRSITAGAIAAHAGGRRRSTCLRRPVDTGSDPPELVCRRRRRHRIVAARGAGAANRWERRDPPLWLQLFLLTLPATGSADVDQRRSRWRSDQRLQGC